MSKQQKYWLSKSRDQFYLNHWHIDVSLIEIFYVNNKKCTTYYRCLSKQFLNQMSKEKICGLLFEYYSRILILSRKNNFLTILSDVLRY